MAALNEISPASLMRLIGTPQCFVIVDICIDEDSEGGPHLIPTAIRQRHDDLDGLVKRLAALTAVVVYQKDLKFWHRVAGGNVAWRVAGLSRTYRDDTAQLNAALPQYDALYRCARHGQDDGHTWPAGGAG
jgi:hypothetical protein